MAANAQAAIQGRPKCPSYIREDETAAEAWDKILDDLEQLGALAKTDGAALALYCSAFSRWVYGNEQLRKHGPLVESRGALKCNPAAAMVAAAESSMLKILAEFGLTPSSRTRLNLQAEEQADELDAFVQRRTVG